MHRLEELELQVQVAHQVNGHLVSQRRRGSAGWHIAATSLPLLQFTSSETHGPPVVPACLASCTIS